MKIFNKRTQKKLLRMKIKVKSVYLKTMINKVKKLKKNKKNKKRRKRKPKNLNNQDPIPQHAKQPK